MQTQGSKIRF